MREACGGIGGQDSQWIGTMWLSPGNLGPDEATNVIIPTMYTAARRA